MAIVGFSFPYRQTPVPLFPILLLSWPLGSQGHDLHFEGILFLKCFILVKFLGGNID